jgi:hypothetical protein
MNSKYDDENKDIYVSVENLLRGLQDGRLLVHARVSDSSNFKYGLEPSAGSFLRSTESWQTAIEIHGSGPELIFLSDNLDWAQSSVLADVRGAKSSDIEVLFIQKNESIVKYLKNNLVMTADGSEIAYEMCSVADFENPLFKGVPAGVENGDWFTSMAQEVLIALPAKEVLDCDAKMRKLKIKPG